jgi:hypothetical protein
VQPVEGLSAEVRRIVVDLPDDPIAMLGLVFLGCVVFAVLVLLGALARAALVDQVRAAEERDEVSLRKGWRAGMRFLWPVFGARLLLWLPVVGVVLAGALPAIGIYFAVTTQEKLGVVAVGVLGIEFSLIACLAPAVCLAALLTIPLGVLRRLAVRACVLGGHGVRTGIASARAMLRHRRGWLALLWLVLLGVRAGVLVVVGVPGVLVAVSLLTGSLVAALASPQFSLSLALGVELLAWLVGLAAVGMVETFCSGAWTLAYRDLAGLGLTGDWGWIDNPRPQKYNLDITDGGGRGG